MLFHILKDTLHNMLSKETRLMVSLHKKRISSISFFQMSLTSDGTEMLLF